MGVAFRTKDRRKTTRFGGVPFLIAPELLISGRRPFYRLRVAVGIPPPIFVSNENLTCEALLPNEWDS